MSETLLIRRVRFRARHHYRREGWGEGENRRVFGEQSGPHEHEWALEVRVAGPVDPETGWVVDLGGLDAALERLTAGWDGANLNALVPPVASGAITPSTENLARWIFEELTTAVDSPARLVQVRVFESPELGSAYPA